MQPQFKVDYTQTKGFADVYTVNGLAIPITPPYIQFATDFANIVLANFIAHAQRAAQIAAEKRVTAQDKKPLIIEG